MTHRRDVVDPAVLQIGALKRLVAGERVAQLQSSRVAEAIPGGIQVLEEFVAGQSSAYRCRALPLDAVPAHIQFSQPKISTGKHFTDFFTTTRANIVLPEIQLEQPRAGFERPADGHCSLVTASVLAEVQRLKVSRH